MSLYHFFTAKSPEMTDVEIKVLVLCCEEGFLSRVNGVKGIGNLEFLKIGKWAFDGCNKSLLKAVKWRKAKEKRKRGQKRVNLF